MLQLHGGEVATPADPLVAQSHRAEEASTQLVARRGARANPDSVSVVS